MEATPAIPTKQATSHQFVIRLRVENGKCRGSECLVVTVDRVISKKVRTLTLKMLEAVIGEVRPRVKAWHLAFGRTVATAGHGGLCNAARA